MEVVCGGFARGPVVSAWLLVAVGKLMLLFFLNHGGFNPIVAC